jgi:hypothetical protein
MHGWVDRWSACGFALLAALFVAPSLVSGCGGAASDSLSDPAGTATDAGNSSKSTSEDAASTTPPVGAVDATAIDATSGADDAAEADGSAELDGALPAEDAAPHDAGLDTGLCATTCAAGMRCCMTRGALYFGQCYSPALCAGCCF